jgi:hypothetical protein
VFGSLDVHRAGTRRILTCPYCNGLQAIPPQPVGFAIGCKKCHRVFRIAGAGPAPASDRTDEAVITPRPRPGRVFIDRRVEPADGGSKQALACSPSNRSLGILRGTLRGLRSTAIVLLALAAAAAAAYALLAVLDSTHTAVRRALPEGSTVTVRRSAKTIRQPGHKAGEARGALPRSTVLRHQE